MIAENFPRVFDTVEGYPVEMHINNYIDAGQGLFMCLDGFAKQFSYSKFYLEKRFHNAYGIGLIAYRNETSWPNKAGQHLHCDLRKYATH